MIPKVEELLNIIGNVGFPIAVSAYLLIRVEAKLGELSKAITQLREAIITLPGRECFITSAMSSRGETGTFPGNPPVI